MTVNQNELLSALVDGELQGKALEQALDLLQSDEQAIVQFQRYQLASDTLHGHAAQSNTDLTARISASLIDEPAFSTKKAQIIPFPKQFWKQATSLAVAASIGALAVIGVTTQPQFTPEVTVATTEAPMATFAVAKKANRWTVGEAEVEDRLNTYLLDHNEYTSTSDVFSYARVVSYSAGQ
ncbi:MAG: sigma-E factor negative regulatory protein [Proteobacteria bacterium]|nr:sigma-E factor negative regulatory protein [Pseudomonadota bacterium]